jgi:DNA mismatch repair protein MutS2
MAGQGTVRIVHGKGTGALRRAIREQLQGHPLVKSYTAEKPELGGDGVTVVTLLAT